MYYILLDKNINGFLNGEPIREFEGILNKGYKSLDRCREEFFKIRNDFVNGKLDCVRSYDPMESWMYSNLSDYYIAKWRKDEDGILYEYDLYIDYPLGF